MDINAEKTNLMINKANDIQRESKVKWQKLGTVTSIKYLGAVVSGEVSKPGALSRIVQGTAALNKQKAEAIIGRLHIFWIKSKTDALPCLTIFLYACESWALTAELEKRTMSFEMRCY